MQRHTRSVSYSTVYKISGVNVHNLCDTAFLLCCASLMGSALISFVHLCSPLGRKKPREQSDHVNYNRVLFLLLAVTIICICNGIVLIQCTNILCI